MGRTFVVQVETSSTRPFPFVAADMASALREAGFRGVSITGGEPFKQEKELLRQERDELAEWYRSLRDGLRFGLTDVGGRIAKGDVKAADATRVLLMLVDELMKG